MAYKGKYGILVSMSLLIIAFDQWTKYLIHTKFSWGESLPLIDSFFNLTYVRNSGAAFGLLHKAPPAFRDPFFLIVPLIALAVIFYLFTRLTREQNWTATALSLIVGGAIGNLIDRVRFGYVIDFLDFHWKENYHYPAFNVADSCIVIGVGMMLIRSFFRGKACITDGETAKDPSRPGVHDKKVG